jgi:hypothetical protein
MLGGSGGSGGSNECNRVAHSRTKKYPALWRPYFWNQPHISQCLRGKADITIVKEGWSVEWEKAVTGTEPLYSTFIILNLSE